MGKKYIIELEEEPFIKHFKNGAWETIYRVKGFNSLVFDYNGLGKLTPYTEPDLEQVRKEAYEDGYKTAKVQCNIQAEKDLREVGERHYQKGLSDAWECARKIVNSPLSNHLEEIFNTTHAEDVLPNFSISEAIEKIRQYEQEEQIQVGDEVRFKNTGNKFVVTRVFASVEGHKCDKCEGLFDDGEVYESVLDVVEKTGRHFPEIAEVLAKMKEK